MTDAMEPASGISRHTRDNARFTMFLFVAFVLIGAGYIFYAKEHLFGQKYITFGPVVIMLVFALVMLFSSKFRLRDDQAGDNLYYMGFVFTLISLGTTLYEFSDSQDKNQIVQNFGIAIATTICGIVLRIFFAGMRQDPLEIERQSRLELAEAARLVKIELDNTTLEFSSFSREMKQILEDRFKDMEVMHQEMSARVSSACDKFFISIDEASKRSSESIELTTIKASDAITSIAENMAKPITEGSKEIRETLKTSSASLTSSLSAISRNISNQGNKLIEANDQTSLAIKEQLDGLVTQIEAMQRRFAAVQTPEKAINIALTPSIDALAERVSHFEKSSIDQINYLISNFTQIMSTQGNDLRKAIDGLNEIISKLDTDFKKSDIRSPVSDTLHEKRSVFSENNVVNDTNEEIKKQIDPALESQSSVNSKSKKWFFG